VNFGRHSAGVILSQTAPHKTTLVDLGTFR